MASPDSTTEIFCIDCTHYDVGDKFGKVLALACQSSYLSFVVLISASFSSQLYARDIVTDISICQMLQLCDAYELCVLSSCLQLQATYGHRTLENVGIFLGAVLSAILGKILKSAWRQPRPSAK